MGFFLQEFSSYGRLTSKSAISMHKSCNSSSESGGCSFNQVNTKMFWRKKQKQKQKKQLQQSYKHALYSTL